MLTDQIPSIAIVKLEFGEDDIVTLCNSDDDVCATIYIFNTSPFQFRNTTLVPFKMLLNIEKSP